MPDRHENIWHIDDIIEEAVPPITIPAPEMVPEGGQPTIHEAIPLRANPERAEFDNITYAQREYNQSQSTSARTWRIPRIPIPEPTMIHEEHDVLDSELDCPDPTQQDVDMFIMEQGLNSNAFRTLDDLVMAGYHRELYLDREPCDCGDCRQTRRDNIINSLVDRPVGDVDVSRFKFVTPLGGLPMLGHFEHDDRYPKFDLRVEIAFRYRVYVMSPVHDSDIEGAFSYMNSTNLRWACDALFKRCSQCGGVIYKRLTLNFGSSMKNVYIMPNEEGVDGVMCWHCFQEKYRECQQCSTIYPLENEDGDDNFYCHDDEYICNTCDSEYYDECGGCENRFHRDGLHWVDSRDEYLCDSCYQEVFISCSACGHDYEQDDSEGQETTDGWVCQDCVDEFFTECPSCGRYARTERGREMDYEGELTWLCRECAGETGVSIRNHSYKPRPHFFRLKNEASESKDPGQTLFMGFELEVENVFGRIDNEMMCVTLDKFFTDSKVPRFAYFKRDGSLANGFEIVSHPVSWGWFLSNRQFLVKMLTLLKDKGFRSWNTNSCGLHVHMNKTAFSGQRLYKFMKFFHENGDFLYTLSCRKSFEELRQWARVDSDGATKRNLSYEAKNKMKREGGRYWAVNLEPQTTIEIRIFKGTLNENSFLRAFEFLRSLYLFTGNGVATIAKTAVPEYKTFVKTLPDTEFPCLKQTLESRRFVRGNAYRDQEGD